MNSSPEDTVLLCCARTSMDKAVIHKVKEALNSGLNWNYIIENALQHGVSPLLYHNLSEIGDEGVPEKVMKHLRGQYYATLARNMFYYNELSKILQSFKDDGIEVIVLKGAALAETVYQDIGLRPFNDIDILIRREDLQKAKEIVNRIGYVLREHVSEDTYEKFGFNLEYIKRDTTTILEPHWHIARKTGSEGCLDINMDAMWENALSAVIVGVDVFVLSPEDLLLHLCVHLPSHRYSRLIWFCDILEVVEHTDIDWEYVIGNANKYRTKAYMYYGLHFTDELLGCDLPEEVLNELKPPLVEIKVFSTVLKDVLSSKRKIMPIFNLMKILLIDRKRDRFRYLGAYIFPPMELLARKYSVSGKKVYFYYIVHPVHVWFKTVRRLAAIVGSSAKKLYR